MEVHEVADFVDGSSGDIMKKEEEDVENTHQGIVEYY